MRKISGVKENEGVPKDWCDLWGVVGILEAGCNFKENLIDVGIFLAKCQAILTHSQILALFIGEF